MKNKYKITLSRTVLVAVAAGIITATTITLSSIQSVPDNLNVVTEHLKKNHYLDRNNINLNKTYENKWNIHDQVKLHDIPSFMQQAIISAEDKRFYSHNGVDWIARLSAVKQNILLTKKVRGASTITEQVVKMLHIRPRTVWTRWLEGFEAQNLEQNMSKIDILEFYLNQVPYAARRRGIKQAALYYFNRDLQTLNKKEMLALAVMVRSPKWLNPYHYPKKLDKTIQVLAKRMLGLGLIDDSSLLLIQKQKLIATRSPWKSNSQHFLQYVKRESINKNTLDTGIVFTTLDTQLQLKAQKALDTKLDSMRDAHVLNGAILIVEHGSNDIISWVVGQAGKNNKPYNDINAVLTVRQPGSALKPFLYAKAIDKGWTAATMIADTPLEESVGLGLHSYHNYSRGHYGQISVRESLGNSLNIPAIRTIQFIGVAEFLDFLNNNGIKSLAKHPNVYGDGLALGNGELTLFELVQAYTTLARRGSYKSLSAIAGQSIYKTSYPVINPDIASLISNILSDPNARAKEFGSNSILNFPQQTAVKTGTSSDYRDAWAIGYNDRYTIGVWFGNLDYSSMQEVTGSTGPALVLRTLFNELNRGRQVRALYFSPNLVRNRVCINTGQTESNNCSSKDEWFLPGTRVKELKAKQKPVRIRKPSNGLRVAMDPRIPDKYEVFEFELNSMNDVKQVDWYINGENIGSSTTERYQWNIQKGEFKIMAKIFFKNKIKPLKTKEVSYTVY